MHNFYYDETEHSRKLTLNTLNAPNYYDNFTTVILGWDKNDEDDILMKYCLFEEKHKDRMKSGELKSTTMNNKDFVSGIASMTKHTISFYEELLSLYDNRIIKYFSISSKIEYLLIQMLFPLHNEFSNRKRIYIYSLTKAILSYRPNNVINALFSYSETFLVELKTFLGNRIKQNSRNMPLKKRENAIFSEILYFLDTVRPIQTFDWNYTFSFDGFHRLLAEMQIHEYSLSIDKEGSSKTLYSALEIGLVNVKEVYSHDCVGTRMADMLASIISKMMQSLSKSLKDKEKKRRVEKITLELSWFNLNERQFELYKQLFYVISEGNKYWYNSFAGMYADDLIVFVSLLQYISSFNNLIEFKMKCAAIHSERFNTFVCEKLENHYKRVFS